MNDDDDMPPKPDRPYPIGRGRPPPEGKFKPGQSGNPSGRPKGRKRLVSVEDLLASALARPVTVNGEQAPIITAILNQTTQLAAQGDRFARRDILRLLPRAAFVGDWCDIEADAEAAGREEAEADERLMELLADYEELLTENEDLQSNIEQLVAIIRDMDPEWDSY